MRRRKAACFIADNEKSLEYLIGCVQAWKKKCEIKQEVAGRSSA